MDGEISQSLTIQKETIAQVVDEIMPLFQKHWGEIALNKDKIKLDPDMNKYRKLESIGALHIFTVRMTGKLVGYAVYFIHTHAHYKSDLVAISDIFWLSPESRRIGAGKSLFQFVEDWLRSRGVSVMHTTCKVDHTAAHAMLEGLGHSMIEYGYSKLLKT